MRGKHGNAAKNRHERAELEQRARTAERQVVRAETELADLRDSSQRSIEGLRGELSRARKDRDDAAGPALAQAEAQIRQLMAERDSAQQQYKQLYDKWQSFIRSVKDVLYGMGLTNVEAVEVLVAASMPDGSARTVISDANASVRKGTPEQVLVIDRARRKRGAVDLLADRKTLATGAE